MEAQLASRLALAWDDDPIALPPELVPGDADSAYAVQHLTLSLRGQEIGAWKVGAKGSEGPPQGAPLPAALSSPARLPLAGYRRLLGLELEIAFRFGRDFAPREQPYSDAEVLAGVDGVCAAIELVASRLCGDADKPAHPLAQLADLQNHGALVAGDCVPYDAGFNFENPALNWQLCGQDRTPAAPANPAGDPRRLLAWVINHGRSQGLVFKAGTLITTGTFTGCLPPPGPGEALGQIAGLPPVSLALF
jgi:2-keto-4-pentenoate hydratase